MFYQIESPRVSAFFDFRSDNPGLCERARVRPSVSHGSASSSSVGSGASARAVTISGLPNNLIGILDALGMNAWPAASNCAERRLQERRLLAVAFDQIDRRARSLSPAGSAMTAPGKPPPEPRSTQRSACRLRVAPAARCRGYGASRDRRQRRRRDQIDPRCPAFERRLRRPPAGRMFHVKRFRIRNETRRRIGAVTRRPSAAAPRRTGHAPG